MTHFNQLFSLRFGISSQTRILEMCGWDEEKCEEVIDSLSECLEKTLESGKISSKDSILNEASIYLSRSFEEHEVEILVDIIREAVENFNFLIDKSPEYEN